MRHSAFLNSILLSIGLIGSGCGDEGGGDDDDGMMSDAGMDAALDSGPECATDAQCDDDVFCTGEETCDNGSCVSPGDPCMGTFADGGTMELVCDEAMNACVGCVENSNCPDALPVCFDGVCVECTTTMDDECTGATPICDGVAMQCVECITNADCTGNDICEDDVCVPTHEVSGEVIGLPSGESVILRINGGDDETVMEAGGDDSDTFTFNTRLPAGTAYAVTVFSHPTTAGCIVTQGAGTVGTADVTGLAVSCGKLMFVSEGIVDGDHTPAQFDADCQTEAGNASLPSSASFRAWVSDGIGAADRVPAVGDNVPIIRVDGVRVADNRLDLIDGDIDNAINLQADGASSVGDVMDRVWTGTDSDGITLVGNCDDWGNLAGVPGVVGHWVTPYAQDDDWTNQGTHACNETNRFYCIRP